MSVLNPKSQNDGNNPQFDKSNENDCKSALTLLKIFEHYTGCHEKSSFMNYLVNPLLGFILTSASRDDTFGKNNKSNEWLRILLYITCMFEKHMFYTTLPDICAMLKYKKLPNLFEKRLHIVIIENDENYVLHHGFKNYVNIGCNILEIITSQFIDARKHYHVYHRLLKLSGYKGQFYVSSNRSQKYAVKFNVYTFNPQDVDIGTIICIDDNVLLDESRISLEDSIQIPYPFHFTFFSEQSTSFNAKKRAKVFYKNGTQVRSTITKALSYGSKSATSNFNSDSKCIMGPVDMSFETILNSNIQTIKDLKQTFVNLFENSRLGFIKASDLPHLKKPQKFIIDGEIYFIACYDYITDSFVISEREGDEYVRKLNRFFEGNHVGRNVDDNGTDSVNPDFVFSNYLYDNRTELFNPNFIYSYYHMDNGTDSVNPVFSNYPHDNHERRFFVYEDEHKVKFIDGESKIDENYYLTKIAKMFSNVTEDDKQKYIKKIETYEQIIGKQLTDVKEDVMKKLEYTPVPIKQPIDTILGITHKEIVCNGFKIPYCYGYNRLLCDVNELGISNFVSRQKCLINGRSIIPNYFGKIDLIDYIMSDKDFDEKSINDISILINSLKNGSCKHWDKDQIIDFALLEFDKLIINKLHAKLTELTNFENKHYIIPNPNYLIDLIAKEDNIDFITITQHIETGQFDFVVLELSRLTRAINRELNKPIKKFNKILLLYEDEKYKIIEEAVRKFLKKYKKSFDKEVFSDILFSVFESHVELPSMECKSEIIKSTLEEFWGLDSYSTIDDWINTFLQINSTKPAILVRKIKERFDVFSDYFKAENKCRLEDESYIRALYKTLDRAF